MHFQHSLFRRLLILNQFKQPEKGFRHRCFLQMMWLSWLHWALTACKGVVVVVQHEGQHLYI